MLRFGLITIVVAACDRSPSAPVPAPAPTAAVAPTSPQRVARSIPIDPPAKRGTSPNIVATSHGVLMTWLEPIDDTPAAHRLRLSRLVDNAWTPPTTITEGQSIVANWADVPSVAALADGTLVAHWAEKAKSPVAHAYDLLLARSTDDGATWERLGMPHRDGTAAEHGFVSLLPDGDAVLAVWLDGRASANGGGGPTMLRAARIGSTIGSEEVIEDRVCDCCSTSAAMGADGPVVVYRDRDGGELRDPWIVRRTKAGWSAPSAVHRDAWEIAGCPVNGPAVVASGKDVVVAWYTFANQRAAVRVAFSSDGGATFAAPIEIDSTAGARVPIGRVDVVSDRPGEAIVSWTASERDEGQLLLRRVSRDGRRGPELAIAAIAAAREGGFPKIEAVGEDLLIAWSDTKARTVRAVRLPRDEVPAVPAVAIEAHRRPAQVAQSALPVGGAAPEYKATLLDGTAISLASRRGQPLLVNVWATWCEPCRHEMPVLATVHTRNRERGLRVVAISVDREASADKIGAIARRLAPELEIWLDPEDRASGVLVVSTVPTTLLFDAQGILRWRRDGVIVEDDKDLAAAIDSVVVK